MYYKSAEEGLSMVLPTKSKTAGGLVEQAVETLRRRILQGEFSEGLLPPQSKLCEELGVSRSVIREAMQRLQSQRLIELGQGRLPRVLPASPDALAESLQMVMGRTDATWFHLGQVRLTLETEIAGLAAASADAVQLREMEKTIGAMMASDDVREQVSADMRFHRLLAQATGNPIYVFLLDAMAALLRASRERTIGTGGIEPALRGHRQILDALKARNAVAARKAMVQHLSESQDDLRRLIDSGKAPPLH
jgi:DNA-binding FadR family transcriptional regulator